MMKRDPSKIEHVEYTATSVSDALALVRRCRETGEPLTLRLVRGLSEAQTKSWITQYLHNGQIHDLEEALEVAWVLDINYDGPGNEPDVIKRRIASSRKPKLRSLAEQIADLEADIAYCKRKGVMPSIIAQKEAKLAVLKEESASDG